MSSTPNRAKDNPKLRERAISDGKKSLYLEYYISSTRTPKRDAQGKQMFYTTGKMAGRPMYEIKHHRRKEELKLYLYAKPRTAEELLVDFDWEKVPREDIRIPEGLF